MIIFFINFCVNKTVVALHPPALLARAHEVRPRSVPAAIIRNPTTSLSPRTREKTKRRKRERAVSADVPVRPAALNPALFPRTTLSRTIRAPRPASPTRTERTLLSRDHRYLIFINYKNLLFFERIIFDRIIIILMFLSKSKIILNLFNIFHRIKLLISNFIFVRKKKPVDDIDDIDKTPVSSRAPSPAQSDAPAESIVPSQEGLRKNKF